VRHSTPKLIDRKSYQVRVSPRAKHVCIKVSHLGEVEVVVPKGFDQRQIPEIVQQRQDWIAKTIQRITAERQSFQIEPTRLLPESISLAALSEEWTVIYRPTNEFQVKLMPVAHQLMLQGRLEQFDLCRQVLCRWLQRKAQAHLIPWLQQVSRESNLPFNNASVRGQKTRWASCSSQQSISLNYKLLFLPPQLVHYVFIHELCHTIHLNHSHHFWHLVGEKEPTYKALDQELRRAWRYVPEWIERSL